MATIKFPSRIAHATDSDESARYALRGTLVTPEGFAVATDGRIAACVKVNVEGLDAPTMIPQELGPASKTDLKAEYLVNGSRRCEKHTLVKGQQRTEQAPVREGRFPRVGEILRQVDFSPHAVVAINARLLWRLAQAINVPDSGDVVVLLIPAPDKDGIVSDVVGVLSNHGSCRGEDAGGFGVIMPCDANVAEVLADFAKLREGAAASVDAAAKDWSECSSPASKSVAEPSPRSPKQSPKPRRRATRRQSVA